MPGKTPDWLKTILLNLLAPVLATAVTMFITLKVTETNVENLQEAVDSLAVRVGAVEHMVNQHETKGTNLKARVDENRQWIADHGGKIIPKVEIALERIEGVRTELKLLRREIGRRR